ncbi:MAG: rhomboid family intramembrane serine protease [Desulfobacterales bacterium]|nr:rhomboid family intramembrane serine protease [Desulfobacterales bacterium]
MIQLFANLSAEQTDICSLVLSSAGIVHRVRKDPDGWAVWVEAHDYDAAYQAMMNYFNENSRDEWTDTTEAPRPQYDSRFIEALFAAVFLMVWHLAFDIAGAHEAVVQRFGAAAGEILNGELYRAVTALMIHADAAHLVGNMVGIVIFGTAVAAETGWGLGWLMILASGIAGNLLNAGLYKTGHLSIGASTAVFGALGILAGYQMLRRFRSRGKRLAALAPLACGLALLGFIGSGENVDIMAHLFGFITGLGMGAVYAVFCRIPLNPFFQAGALFLVMGVIFSSWVWAAA